MHRFIVITVISLASLQASAITLNEALISAYNNNDDLKISRRDFLFSIEQFPQALSEFLPSVTGVLDSSKTRSKSKSQYGNGAPSSETKNLQRGIVLEQPIFNGGASIAKLKGVQESFRASRSQFYANEQKTLLKAIEAYITCYETKEKYDISETSVKANHKQLEAMQERLNVGEATQTELASARSAHALAETRKLSAYANLQTAKANFTRIFGVEPIDITLPEVPNDLPPTFEEFIKKSLLTNQDIETARYLTKISKADEMATKGGLLPQVSLKVDNFRNYYDPENPNTGALNSSSISSTLSVRVPIIPKGGAVYSQIRQAKIANRKDVIKLEQKIKEVNASCISSWEGYNMAKSSIISSTEGVEAAQIAYDGSVQEELVGTKTILEVLTAEEKLNQNKIGKVEAIKQHILAAYEIKSLQGQLTAKSLKLNVNYFNPEDEFKKVKMKIIGF